MACLSVLMVHDEVGEKSIAAEPRSNLASLTAGSKRPGQLVTSMIFSAQQWGRRGRLWITKSFTVHLSVPHCHQQGAQALPSRKYARFEDTGIMNDSSRRLVSLISTPRSDMHDN